MDIMQKNLQLSRDFASRPRRSVRLNAPVLSQQDEEEDWADEEASRAGDDILHNALVFRDLDDERPNPWDDLDIERPAPVMDSVTVARAIRDLYENQSSARKSVRSANRRSLKALKYAALALASSAMTLLIFAVHIAK